MYEIKNSETKTYYKNKEYYPVRYIHAEYDLISKSFRHFDGALQLLTEKEYYQLFTENVYETKNQKLIKAKSLKLFKINGQINIDLWQDFCCHFLSGNPLIHEYFTGKLPDNIEDAIIKLTKPSPTIPP